MIRINLLPFRAARKKEDVRKQVGIFFLSIIFLFTLMAYLTLNLDSRLAASKSEEDRLRKELSKYFKVTGKINQIRQKTEETRSKLVVIRGLEEKKTGPGRLLDEIAMAVPRDKLWLRSLNEGNGLLTLEGTAMDNNTVALFMTNLERTPLINSVDLKTTKLKHLEKFKLDVTDFVLTCKTSAIKEKEKPKPKTKRPRKRNR